ncbi:MAG: rod shape-determining protein [Candidatus Delongbacteria bacterium]|nr:rod shape-determining protein [Candidatus Delongbacteria bacterium]
MSFLAGDIGIDLGTANTLIHIERRGIVVNEPSVVAQDVKTRKILAIGNEAKEMVGRTPNEIVAVRPLKDGVIADFELTEEMLRLFLKKVQKYRWLIRPRIVICVPSGITEVEKRAVKDAAEHAGAREVYLATEPMAAAIGVGLPVDSPTGSMIIDIGGGTTEIAVIALGGIVNGTSIRVGGDEMDEAIIQYMKKTYNLLIGERTAEQIKFRIGSAYPTSDEEEMEVKGRDLIAGIPKTIKITSSETREAMAEPINDIVEAVKLALEKTPPELSADILDRGIIMTGGSSMLKGLDERLRQETNLPINVVEDPLTCVVRGAGKILSDLSYYSKILIKNPQH